MTTTNAANNRDLALRFVEAFDSRDLQAIDHLLADDFVWHVAVVPEGVTQFRPFQSEELQGRKHTHTSRPARQRATLAFFGKLFRDGEDANRRFRLRLINVISDGNQVAFEAEGELPVPDRNRLYRNIYFVLLRVRDGKIVLYKEYQDTLHIYDVFVAQ